MPTAFETRFKNGPARRLLDEFGEPIVFAPRVGDQRTITAMVDRYPLESVTETGVLAPGVVIHVLDDATDGISSAALDLGGDHVQVAVWPGKAAVSLPITTREPDADAGLLSLVCGR